MILPPGDRPVDMDLFQSPTGHVYFAAAYKMGLVKIGFGRNPVRRIQEWAPGCPSRIALWALIPGTVKDEKALHRRFRYLRSHGEWFKVEKLILDFMEPYKLPEVIYFTGAEIEPPKFRVLL